ncbi:PP2C family protein-serine/threonine phosphatase [Thermodesulfobacteriota bacterium]
MKFKIAGKSHIGMKRKLNEDSYLISPDLDLYVIADGMGGHKAGEIASRMVVETMEDYWKKVNSSKVPSFIEPIEKDISEGAKHLINSISLTNIIIHEAQKKPQYHRMGSTVSALLVEKDCVWSANVGDSPVYIFDHGHMILISEEHSVEAEQKSMGLYDSFSSTNPLMKNMLTRVLGLNKKVDVFTTQIRPEAGDIILMCSDGLTNYLSMQSIRIILNDFSLPLEQKVDVLIDEANHGGGGDNISVILLEVLEEGRWGKLIKRFKFKG